MHQATVSYARTSRTGLSVRALEATVLSQCANRLAASLDAAEPARELISALDENQKAWAIIARALRQGNTDLPEPERRNLSVTIDFVVSRTVQLLRVLPERIEAGKVLDLIELNRALAAGLRGEAA